MTTQETQQRAWKHLPDLPFEPLPEEIQIPSSFHLTRKIKCAVLVVGVLILFW